MTWSEFYDNFYDWAESTAIKKLSSVDKYGSADEVTEIINEFCFNHKEISERMARKAIAQKMIFSAENVSDLVFAIDDSLVNQIALQSVDAFSEKELMDVLYGSIDDDILIQIFQKKGLTVPEELSFSLADSITELVETVNELSNEQASNEGKRPGGFFSKLGMLFAVGEGVRQGIGDVASPKPHRFRVGDHVRVRFRGQEGTIIDINGDLYMVSMNDGGYVDSYTEDQLDRAW